MDGKAFVLGCFKHYTLCQKTLAEEGFMGKESTRMVGMYQRLKGVTLHVTCGSTVSIKYELNAAKCVA